MKIKLAVLAFCVAAQGCSKLDDYMLGKDNTPKPKKLAEIRNKVNVAQNWTAPISKSVKNPEYLRLKPEVYQGVVYTADANGLVHAVKKSNGEQIWNTQLTSGVVSGPTLAHGYIALGTNNSSLIVLNQADGTIAWQAKVSGEILSPPTIAKQKIIAKTIDGNVYAFNAADGKQLWISQHGSPNLILKTSSAPIVTGHLVLVGFPDGKMDAIDIDNGRLVWQRSISYATGSSDVEGLVDIDADPIVDGNIVYIASYQGYVGALSLTDGEFIWKKPSSVYKNMLLANNSLFVSDSNDVLWSFNKNTGDVNWKQKMLKARGLTSPVLVGKDVAVGDKTGYLHFVDAQSGELLGRFKAASGVSLPLSVVGKQLYVLTDNGMLNQLSVS